MIKLYNEGVYLINEKDIVEENDRQKLSALGLNASIETARKNTISYSILEKHNQSNDIKNLKIKFDALTSHDITYVGIVQTARASGLKEFPVPYTLTNCHNSLCAVGGTINQDDHVFGLSAAKKYGGIYVPSHVAVIHQYMREMGAGCGKMILGSDSHTRYGALGTIAMGEGGGELVKQISNKTYDIDYPEIVGVYLKGKPKNGVGPQDVALAIIKNVFKNGFVKNKIMEFVGDGIRNLDVDFRNGIDVMTTETTCLSSIWSSDDKVREYLNNHNRACDYKELKPGDIAYYDSMIKVDLDKIECMIAMPAHPSNVFTIKELNENVADIVEYVENEGKKQNLNISLKDKIKNKKLYAQQGIIAGCSGGTYDNIIDARDILNNKTTGNDVFNLDIYPSSQPIFLSLVENGTIADILSSGAIVKTAFCGPCFGAGDTPANNQLSIRHTTRNFPNREGSNPSLGQSAFVALMDARSIAASSINNGEITAATDLDIKYSKPKYYFKNEVYKKVVYFGYGKPDVKEELVFGPNIVDWPHMPSLTDSVLLKIAAVINDPVTTTDELIPSGETSSYRSNPLRLAEYTLFRREPDYVKQSKSMLEIEKLRESNNLDIDKFIELNKICNDIKSIKGFDSIDYKNIGFGSLIYANKPGDGSAREQAASCQRVLGGWVNIAKEYATKRYRSNLINWGIIPFIINSDTNFIKDSFVFIPNVKQAIETKSNSIKAYVIGSDIKEIILSLPNITDDECRILICGGLINYYKSLN